MSSEFSAVSLHSPADTAGRQALAPMPLILFSVVFAIAVGLRQIVPLNTDVSWLLVVCERMLDGQHAGTAPLGRSGACSDVGRMRRQG